MFSNVKEEDFDRWNVKRMRKWLAGAGREGGEGKHWTVVAKRGEALIGYAHYEVGEGKEGERDAHEKEVESEFDEFPEGTDVEAARVMFDAIVASERSIRGGYISESDGPSGAPFFDADCRFLARSAPSTRQQRATPKAGRGQAASAVRAGPRRASEARPLP